MTSSVDSLSFDLEVGCWLQQLETEVNANICKRRPQAAKAARTRKGKLRMPKEDSVILQRSQVHPSKGCQCIKTHFDPFPIASKLSLVLKIFQESTYSS